MGEGGLKLASTESNRVLMQSRSLHCIHVTPHCRYNLRDWTRLAWAFSTLSLPSEEAFFVRLGQLQRQAAAQAAQAERVRRGLAEPSGSSNSNGGGGCRSGGSGASRGAYRRQRADAAASEEEQEWLSRPPQRSARDMALMSATLPASPSARQGVVSNAAMYTLRRPAHNLSPSPQPEVPSASSHPQHDLSPKVEHDTIGTATASSNTAVAAVKQEVPTERGQQQPHYAATSGSESMQGVTVWDLPYNSGDGGGGAGLGESGGGGTSAVARVPASGGLSSPHRPAVQLVPATAAAAAASKLPSLAHSVCSPMVHAQVHSSSPRA